MDVHISQICTQYILLYNLIDSRHQHSYFSFKKGSQYRKKQKHIIYIRVENKIKGNWLIMSYYYAFKKKRGARWLSRNRFSYNNNNNGVYMYTEMWGTRGWRRFIVKTNGRSFGLAIIMIMTVGIANETAWVSINLLHWDPADRSGGVAPNSFRARHRSWMLFHSLLAHSVQTR